MLCLSYTRVGLGRRMSNAAQVVIDRLEFGLRPDELGVNQHGLALEPGRELKPVFVRELVEREHGGGRALHHHFMPDHFVHGAAVAACGFAAFDANDAHRANTLMPLGALAAIHFAQVASAVSSAI